MSFPSGPSAPLRPAPRGCSASSSNGAVSRPLGNNAKSVDQTAQHQRNLARYASKWAAANILKNHGNKAAKRVSHCGYVAFQPFVDLERNAATAKASFRGVKSCSSVWLCPVCSPRISTRRRDELNALLSGARAADLSPVMLTLTARHDRSMKLAPFLDALKRAKQRLRQRREWKALVFAGSVTATEVTHGANGWHPHFHEVLLLQGGEADALAAVSALSAIWLRCLEAFGLSGGKAAFQVQGAAAAGAYVGKFGAAEELALHGVKAGRNGSRSPWQLLDDARDGDKRAAAIWAEYAAAFAGRRQLVWSPGLKARFVIGEVSDDEAAQEAEAADVPSLETLRTWAASGDWRNARRRRVSIVRAVESGGDLDVAEHGPTDAELWRRDCVEGELIEPACCDPAASDAIACAKDGDLHKIKGQVLQTLGPVKLRVASRAVKVLSIGGTSPPLWSSDPPFEA